MRIFNQNYGVSARKISVEPCKHCILVAVTHDFIVLSQ